MTDKKVLITGGTGLLGSGLFETQPSAISANYSYFTNIEMGTYMQPSSIHLDISDFNAIEQTLKSNEYSHIIHAASIGNIEVCENNKSLAQKINVDATQVIVELAKKYGIKVIYISTNAVFDGLQAPYSEASKPNPTNYYGKTKLEAEKIVLTNKNNTVVRLVLLYGWNSPKQRNNPFTWINDELNKKKKINLVTDIYNNPISNLEAAQEIWKLIQNKFSGILHLAGKERVSRYEFGQMIAQALGHDQNLLLPVDSNYFPNLVPRMPDTTYDISLAQKVLDFNPESLTINLKKLAENKPDWSAT